MFILPSRSRPHNLARLYKACQETGLSSTVWVRLDFDDPLLGAYTAPGWEIIVGPRMPLSRLYNDFYAAFPNLPWYGFIADDVVPETPLWDQSLIDIAGRDGMAVPEGSQDPGGTPHFVLGGDLVRDMGWLCLPGLDRIFIDTVWADVARSRGVLRHAPGVMLRHHHFGNGLALMDGTYRKHHKEEDRAIYEKWRASL